MSPILKWSLIVFGIGIAIVIGDIYMAGKQKGGITAADKQRIWGIVGLTCFMSVGTAAMIWLAQD